MWNCFWPMKLFVQSYFQLEVEPPLQTFDALRARFVPEQNLSSDSIGWGHTTTATVRKKMTFPFNDFSGKREQIHIFLWICSYLLKKSLTENFTVQCKIQKIDTDNLSFFGSCLILCWHGRPVIFWFMFDTLLAWTTCHFLVHV